MIQFFETLDYSAYTGPALFLVILGLFILLFTVPRSMAKISLPYCANCLNQVPDYYYNHETKLCLACQHKENIKKVTGAAGEQPETTASDDYTQAKSGRVGNNAEPGRISIYPKMTITP